MNYIEMNFVGETATGRGLNQMITMENLQDGTFKVTESRVGIRIGRHRPRSFVLPIDEWDNFFNQKTSRGYLVTKTEKMDDIISTESKYAEIPQPEIREIVQRLLDYADQLLESSYTVRISDISDEMLQYGQNILAELAAKYKKMSVAEFNNKLKILYAAIPRRMDKLSKFLVHSKSDFQDKIALEQELYDIMHSRVRDSKEKAGKTILDAYGIEFYSVTAAEEEMLKKMLGENAHEFKQAWRVINRKTEQAFEKYSKGIAVSHLFHGSRKENFWSIISNGLTINPTGVVISGKMFGNGTYFANLARKSLGYVGTGPRFLGVYKVATGTPYYVKTWETSHGQLTWERLQKRQKGAHCTWALGHMHGGTSLYNDEIIVYQDQQSTIEYLIEM